MPQNVNDIDYNNFKFMGLFISENGGGKTVSACSDDSDTYVFDVDNRILPLKRWYPGRKNIYYDTYTVDNIINKMDDVMNGLMSYCPYDWVLVDGITSVTTSVVMAQLNATGDKAKRTSGGKGVKVAGWDEFNGEASFVASMLTELQSLKANVVVTAHPLTKVIADGTKLTEITSFGVKTPGIIPGYFNEIYYFNTIPIGLTGQRRVEVTTCPTPINPKAKTALPIPAVIDISNDPNNIDYSKGLFPQIKQFLKEHGMKIDREKTNMQPIKLVTEATNQPTTNKPFTFGSR